MTQLDLLLSHIGFEHRPQQDALFEALAHPDVAVVAQAGTGVGKSLAVLAAAATHNERTGLPSLVVCPTNILLDQYVDKDGPTAGLALGKTVRGLKGRRHYLCSSSAAMNGMGDKKITEAKIRRQFELLSKAESGLAAPPYAETPEWGCPGYDECSPDGLCAYLQARALLEDAHIIITNAHIFAIDGSGKAKTQSIFEKALAASAESGEAPPEAPSGNGLLPAFGVVFVDEAHTLEGVLRDFTASSINAKTLEDMGCYALANRLRDLNSRARDAVKLDVTGQLVAEIDAVANWKKQPDEKRNQRHEDARNAARRIIEQGMSGAYRDKHAVLYFEPNQRPKHPRIVSEQVTLAGLGQRLLGKTPFALVSATTPSTMRRVLGVPEADAIDVGHPFDYAEQASISFSSESGAFHQTKVTGNFTTRATEVEKVVLESKGGALLLFSSLYEMRKVYERLAPVFVNAGLTVMTQDSDVPNAEIGQAFKDDGNAVLFGSETFATGFDVPGNALRLVVVWKLPYPGLSPITRAISESSRQRYEDMMLMKAVQAIGRLIRASDDRGHVHIADSRARHKLRGTNDPMTRHLNDFRLVEFEKVPGARITTENPF